MVMGLNCQENPSISIVFSDVFSIKAIHSLGSPILRPSYSKNYRSIIEYIDHVHYWQVNSRIYSSVECRTYENVNLFKLTKLTIEPIPGVSNDQWRLISTFPTQHVLRTTAAIPLWIIYAVVQGTLATGPWVIGSLDFKGLHLMQETHGFLMMTHIPITRAESYHQNRGPVGIVVYIYVCVCVPFFENLPGLMPIWIWDSKVLSHWPLFPPQKKMCKAILYKGPGSKHHIILGPWWSLGTSSINKFMASNRAFKSPPKKVKRWINHVTSRTLVIIWKSIVITNIIMDNMDNLVIIWKSI